MWISIWSKFEIRKFKEKKRTKKRKEEKAWASPMNLFNLGFVKASDQSIYPVSERIGPTMKHIY